MRSSTFASLAAVVGTSPSLVLCWSTTSTSGSPTCVTITETTGSSCPAITELCPRPECVELQTITLECGCPSIFSTTICPTGCPRGCGTTYETFYIPCATSVSSPQPVTTTSTSSSSAKSSPSPTSSASTATAYPNSTLTSASTSVITITSCPVSGTCNSQKTTRTGTTGPSNCPSDSTCSAVPTTTTPQTITETTVIGKPGPTSTASTIVSASPLQANEGSRYGFGVVEGGVLVGLIGAVLGMM